MGCDNGLNLVFYVNMQILVLKIMRDFLESEDKVEARLMNLLSLEEKRDTTLQHFFKHHIVVKCWFDKRAKVKAFRIFDLVLFFDKAKKKKGDNQKFEKIFLGPYQIYEILRENTLRINSLTGEPIPFLANGQYLKDYFCP